MPLQASPFTSVPSGISTPATPPSPQLAALLAKLFGGQGAGPTPGAGPMVGGPQMPPGAPPGGPPGGGEPLGLPPGMADVIPPQAPPMPQGDNEPDLFQKVTLLLMDPTTKKINPEMLLLFAGMGLREALEKSGKFRSKPHRSNEELSTQGYDTGTAGQTGVPSPEQMQRSTAPPTSPGMPGF